MSANQSEAIEGAVLDAAFDLAHDDVLTAWRVRNAALAVAASFVHPGPDWEDEQARKRLVEEWVGDGHDQVAEENRQRLVAVQRMIAAEDECERLRARLPAPDPSTEEGAVMRSEPTKSEPHD